MTWGRSPKRVASTMRSTSECGRTSKTLHRAPRTCAVTISVPHAAAKSDIAISSRRHLTLLPIVAEGTVTLGQTLADAVGLHGFHEVLRRSLMEPERVEIRACPHAGPDPRCLHGPMTRAFVDRQNVGWNLAHPLGDVQDG